MSLVQKNGFKAQLRSDDTIVEPTTHVLIGDSMGELLAYYGAADVAFVGGSLIPVGGHNLLEPALLYKPIITGPHVFNFTEIFKLLQQADAVCKVDDAASLAKMVITLLQDSALRQQLGYSGWQVVQQNQGAVERHMKLISTLLKNGNET